MAFCTIPMMTFIALLAKPIVIFTEQMDCFNSAIAMDGVCSVLCP
jgi:hypothetical protein